MADKLSVIIPACNEWPMISFTVRGVLEELRSSGIDFEIIVVDNYCEEVADQHTGLDRAMYNTTQEIVSRFEVAKIGDQIPLSNAIYKLKAHADKCWEDTTKPDRGSAHIKAVEKMHPELKVLEYTERLSHWQAKNLGVRKAAGNILFFMDAHCLLERNALVDMFYEYSENKEKLNGTLHLPLTYHIMENKKLIYKMKIEPEAAWYHYSFSDYHGVIKNRNINVEDGPFEVPCMSCCGVMMSREIYDGLGGWPITMGIYGGGENFINYTLAILGKKKWIMPGKSLFHHGEKRGYHYVYDDMLKNRCTAVYMYGGREMALKFIEKSKGRPSVLKTIYDDVINKCSKQREKIKKQQVISIDDWAKQWTQENK